MDVASTLTLEQAILLLPFLQKIADNGSAAGASTEGLAAVGVQGATTEDYTRDEFIKEYVQEA